MGGTYTVRVIPASDFAAKPAGTASSITSGQVRWSVALGSLKNGSSAGALSIIDNATGDWSSIFKPVELYYEANSTEIYVHRVNGAIRQVSANEAFVDVVTLSSTSYQLNYYHAAAVQGSSYPKTFSSVPFVSYTIQQGATATQLVITKQVRDPSSATDTSAPVVRTESTVLTRTGTAPAFTWSLSDWTLVGSTPLVNEMRVWTANASGGHDETITSSDASGVVAAQVFRSHTHFAWGDTPTTVTAGTTNPVNNTYAYNTDSADQGSYGFISSQQSNGGTWKAYDYFSTTNTKQLGTISQTFQPFVSAPASVSTSASSGLVSTYTYAADAFGMLTRPLTIQSQVNGTIVSNSTIAYTAATVNGMTLVTATSTDKTSGTGSTLASSTSYYQEDTEDDFFRSQVHSVTLANGSKQSFVRQRGTLSGITFTVGSTGKATRIGVINGAASTATGATTLSSYSGYTISTIYLIPNKSTFDVTYRDNYARIARTESSVWDGAAWQLISWVNFSYNWRNQVISRISSNGDDYEAGYNGELKDWEQDGTGITVSYDYDVAGRLLHAIKAGLNGAPDLVTTYTYNASSQVIGQTTSAVGVSDQLTTTRTYDLAGRVASEISPGTGATTYAYDPVNRTTTMTAPDGSTQIQSLYLDGQLASKTGTGVVPEYYTYSIQSSDGQKITQINSATSTSTRLVKTWTDWLGRTTRTEHPGFSGTSQPVFFEQNTYNTTTGLLARTDHTVGSATLYQYDPLGSLILSGLDVNNNGTLDLASADRITGQNKWIVNDSGAWWLATTSYTYAGTGSSVATTLGSTGERLTGFTGNLRSEKRSVDAEGNTTVQTVAVDSTTATVTKTTTLPGFANPQVDVAINGLSVSSTSPDGLVSAATYDGLQRALTSVNPRTGSTTVVYVSGTTLPYTVTDPTGAIVATYSYDTMGRKLWTKNATGHFTRYSYDSLGHVHNQWGDGTYPQSFGYNVYGERTTLSTYQAENGWDGTTWPGGTPTSTTTWAYDTPSGLLTSKTDASGQSVAYTYNSRGQVATRLWGRLNTGGQRVTATYSYDANTGDLLSTAYNDGTPTVSLTYTRLGQTSTVADTTGTRIFGWDATYPWRLNSETLPAYYQGQVMSRLYETTTNSTTGTIKGRSSGFQLGTVASPSASLQQTYTVDNTGRLASLTNAYGSGAASQTFNYAYLANSRLVQSVAAQGTAFTQTRSYETQRDLLTSIVGQWSTTTYSSYGYVYNALVQRQSATQGGTAFADYGDVVTQNYTYNARGELSSAVAGLGSNGASQLPGRDFEYTYDAAGNRLTSNHTGNVSLAEHFSNNFLNQITSRENNSRAIQGTAATDASVQVNTSAADRQGDFWNSELLLNNATGTAVTQASVSVGASVSTGAGASAQTLNLLTAGASESLTYDLDGNLTSDGIWTYTWDAENRLTSMVMNSWAVLPNGPPQQMIQFQYDYMGRRVQKTVLAYQAGSWVVQSQHRFVYDGWNVIAETQSDGLTLIRSYTWGLDLTGSFTAAGGVGGLLQVTDHVLGARYFPTYDGNGNVTTLVNASTGALGAIYEYNSFGELLRSSGTYASSNPIRFSSKYTDDESGLIYYGTRYYDPHNGRFINRDSIEEAGGINLYGFCGNDGVNHWDYLGDSWNPLKKIGKALSHFWNKFRHTIISAALFAIPYVGSYLAFAYSAANAIHYKDYRGLAVLGATGLIGSAIYGTYQQFRHGKFWDNFRDFAENVAVGYGTGVAVSSGINAGVKYFSTASQPTTLEVNNTHAGLGDGMYSDGGTPGAGNSPESLAGSGPASVTPFMDFLRSSVSAFFNKNPGVPYQLSDIDWMAIKTSVLDQIVSAGFGSFNLGDMFRGVHGFDNRFLYDLNSSNTFVLPNGSEATGGDINYIGQGMAWAVNGEGVASAGGLATGTNVLWNTAGRVLGSYIKHFNVGAYMPSLSDISKWDFSKSVRVEPFIAVGYSYAKQAGY